MTNNGPASRKWRTSHNAILANAVPICTLNGPSLRNSCNAHTGRSLSARASASWGTSTCHRKRGIPHRRGAGGTSSEDRGAGRFGWDSHACCDPAGCSYTITRHTHIDWRQMLVGQSLARWSVWAHWKQGSSVFTFGHSAARWPVSPHFLHTTAPFWRLK